MVEFFVDVRNAASWTYIVAAFNEGFVRHVGGEWDGNLDALNNYLSRPDEQPYRLVVRGWHTCADGRPARLRSSGGV